MTAPERDQRRASSSSTTSTRTSVCSTRCSARAGTTCDGLRAARTALAVLGRDAVDVVLLDILMPGIDGYEVCRRIRADERTAFLPVVMITASGAQEKMLRHRGRGRRLPVQAVRPPGAPRAGPQSAARSSATTTPSRSRPPSSPRGTPSWSRAGERQVDELERVGRLRRFLSPQVAELVMTVGRRRRRRRPPPGDHRRLRGPAGVHPLRGDGRAGGGLVGAARLPRGDRRPRHPVRRHARAVHRATGSCCSSTTPSPSTTARPARCGWRSRCGPACRSCPRGGARPGTTSRWASASPRATRRWAGSGSRAAIDYAAIGTVTNVAARLCDTAEPWQVLVSAAGPVRCRGRRRDSTVGRAARCAGLSRPVATFDVLGLDAARVTP